MKIVSWNVHRCIGTDRRYSPERVLEALVEIDADVVALQEVDSSLRVSDGRDQLAFLAQGLKMDSVMGPTLHRDYGAYGNAILSRFEILSCEEHDLSFRRFESRGAIVAELSSSSRRLRVVNTHLGLKYWERSFQIRRILSDLVSDGESTARPTLLLGDFNEWLPFSPNNLRLERAFVHCSPRVATFPAPWPRLALDRIFVSAPESETLRYEVPHLKRVRFASDHLPIVAHWCETDGGMGQKAR